MDWRRSNACAEKAEGTKGFSFTVHTQKHQISTNTGNKPGFHFIFMQYFVWVDRSINRKQQNKDQELKRCIVPTNELIAEEHSYPPSSCFSRSEVRVVGGSLSTTTVQYNAKATQTLNIILELHHSPPTRGMNEQHNHLSLGRVCVFISLYFCKRKS